MNKITEILKAIPTQKIVGYILLTPAVISVWFFFVGAFDLEIPDVEYKKNFLFGNQPLYLYEEVNDKYRHEMKPNLSNHRPYTSLYVAFMALAGAYLIKDKK